MGVLHREVATLRTELGRCSGSVGIPASQTGNSQVDVETDEADENERIGGNGRLTEVSDEIAAYRQTRMRHAACIIIRNALILTD